MKVWLFTKYEGLVFLDKNHDGEDSDAPLLDEDSWEKQKVFDVT